MKTLFAKHKWMQLIYGLLLLAAGILVIVFAINDKERISTWLSIIASIGLFIYAAALMFSGVFSLKKKYFDIAFIYSVLFISIGVVLLCNQEMIGKFITIFVATALTATGVVEIGEATSMIFFKRPIFFIVVFYILGAAFIALGVLAFCFQENVEQVVYVGVGALLCLTALLEIVLGIVSIARHKAIEDDVIDEEVVEKKPEEKEEKKEEEKKDDPVNPDVIDLGSDDNHDNSNPQA